VVGQILIVTVGFGFLITLVLAWYHGEKGRQRVSGPELVMVAALLVVAAATLSMFRIRDPGTASSPADSRLPAPLADDRPSVAVLPFVNLSAETADAYLADGFHEAVLSPGRNVREIARELGATFVVEGTVQKVLDRLRVNTRLIEAASDRNLWTQNFEEVFSLETQLDIQSGIARRVAGALQTRLTPREEALLGTRETENHDAYQAFQRGRYYQDLPHFTEENVARALNEFERAVELDSTFALAWMELANAHAQEVFYWTDTSEERKESARATAQRAMTLDSPSPAVHLGLGLFHLRLERDPEAALKEIAIAEEGIPNDHRVYVARAAVYDLQGRFEEAIEEALKAQNLSPRDPSILTDLGHFYWLARQYPQAEAYAQEAINLAPDQLWPSLTKVMAIWSDRGATPETEELLEGLRHSAGWVIWGRFWQRMLDDRYPDAFQALSDPDFDWIRIKMFARPKPLLEAFVYRGMGLEEEARASFETARAALEAAVAEVPDDARYRSSLGLAYAGLGRGEEAIREGEEGMALLPVSRDAVYGLSSVWDLAGIHAMLGNATESVALLERLLEIPSWITPVYIEGDFRLDRIRNDPAFQSLVERYRPRS
jgi:TolB-like protein/Tfp pilus assembly protein PilF